MKNHRTARWLCLFSALLTFCCAACARQDPAADPGESAAVTEPTAVPAAIDLDLKGLSGVVVYAQVNNLVTDYESWLGKTIRIKGYYTATEGEDGTVYHACIIPDATQCCAQGLEFVRAGEHEYPDDYPEEGAGIIVTGQLEVYEDLGYLFLHLVNSDLVIKADS